MSSGVADATPSCPRLDPWTEVHGYHRVVAPRLQETDARSLSPDTFSCPNSDAAPKSIDAIACGPHRVQALAHSWHGWVRSRRPAGRHAGARIRRRTHRQT